MDNSTRVLALRHGQTAWNAQSRLQGQIDAPLDATGLLQARALASALLDEGIDVIFSSDLQRARVTAQALGDQLSLPVQTDPGLRERHFGFLEGSTYGEIEQRWPEDARAWRQRQEDFACGGGEALREFHERCLLTANTLVSRHAGQVIALVTHGGVLDCLYRAAVGVSLSAPRTWKLGNATINRLLWSPQGFSLVGWDDARHLETLPE